MSSRVVIIGGGVIGLSSAVACARRGHAVTVIERAPEQRGASFGNAGMIVPSHFIPLAAPGMVPLALRWMWNPESPFYLQPRLDFGLLRWAWLFWRTASRAHVERSAPLLRDLHLAGREAYARLADQQDFGLTQKGLLMLCKSQHALDEEAAVATKARALGLPAEVLTAAQTAALDPGLTMDIAGSAYFPSDCHLHPRRLIATLEAQLRASGGEFLPHTEARSFRREGGKLTALITDQGEISGDHFVLSSGAWSPDLVRPLGLRLPMQAGRGYSVTVPDPVELPQLCSILTEARVAVTPMSGSLRFGGTMEITAMNAPPRPRRVEGILKAVPRYFPKFERSHFDNLPSWHGLRPCSPDGLPYLGRTRAAANLIIATGHAMLGLSLAPATGEIVRHLIENEPSPFALHLLSPDRFA